MRKSLCAVLFTAILSSATSLYATPSTQIWNPSTDIQAKGTTHIGIDNYFSVVDNDKNPYAAGTLVGVTYGLVKNLEIGIDLLEPAKDPVMFNAKYALPEGKTMPAVAVGGFNFGTKRSDTDGTGATVAGTDYNILYAVAAKTFGPAGRFTVGYYNGNDKLLVDENGKKANDGLIATWDKTLTDKIWASIDYASGQSFYGSTSVGFSYAVAPNASVLLGYVFYNNDKVNANNQFTTQIDFNF